MWKLLSFSEISAPLVPHEPGYVVGIVEKDDGERQIVQIDEYVGLRIGLAGDIKNVESGLGTLSIFVPTGQDKIKNASLSPSLYYVNDRR